MISYIKSGYSKLAQKEYKTRYIYVEKVIHWDLRKILKFELTVDDYDWLTRKK